MKTAPNPAAKIGKFMISSFIILLFAPRPAEVYHLL
jgi:hypothetical protein